MTASAFELVMGLIFLGGVIFFLKWRLKRDSDVEDDFFRSVMGELQEKDTEYIFCCVEMSETQVMVSHIKQAVDVLQAADFTTFFIASNLILTVRGEFTPLTPARMKIASAAEAVQQRTSCKVKLVYGSRKMCIGNLGSERRACFSFLYPTFMEEVGRLSQMEYGECAAL